MLKYIAMITMLIDHIGYLFFPEFLVFRFIGRVAFPLYAYGIVQGFRFTKDKSKYHNRLLILAFISQIPYTLVFNTLQLNAICTLLIGFYMIFMIERLPRVYSFSLTTFVVLAVFFSPINMDYGYYGIVLILIYYYGHTIHILHVLLNGIHFFLGGWWMQLFSIFATTLISFKDRLASIHVQRFIFRAFYPAHLIVLYLIKVISSSS